MANTKGLGKGLSALLGDDVIAAKDERASSLLLPISQVESCSTQPRKSFEPEALSDRVWSFMELANDVLEKAFLPAFYIPHILERSFLISLCMNGLESENEDIFYFGESPYEIYAAMCQFSVSVTKA